MIPPANNVRKYIPTPATQNYHGTHIISRNLYSIKTLTVFTRKLMHCLLILVTEKFLLLLKGTTTFSRYKNNCMVSGCFFVEYLLMAEIKKTQAKRIH